MPKYSNLCGSQYGEESILEPFFLGQKEAFIVDVGAADGRVNSNTVQLLKHPGFSGVLIEPDPTQFESLSQYYEGINRVKLYRYAIGKQHDTQVFYSAGQVSTLSSTWRKRCEEAYKLHFTQLMVEVRTLTEVLDEAKAPNYIDFLSIDCEQKDREVLDSLNMDKYQVRLICMEGSGYKISGYVEFAKTHGNTFYIKEEPCILQ